MKKKAGSSIGLMQLFHQRIASEAMQVSSDALSVSLAEIKSRRRAKSGTVYARQVAMYLTHVIGQMSLAQVAAEFNRERSTVGYSCHAVEDRRESPLFDEQIERLEACLRERLTFLLMQDVTANAPARIEKRAS